MRDNLAKVALSLLLALLLMLPSTLSEPAWAQGPHPPKSPEPVAEPEEEEELHDSDHNKIQDNLDKRIGKAKDEDTFPVVLLLNRPLAQVDFAALARQVGAFQLDHAYPSINGVALTLSAKQVRAAALFGEVQRVEGDATARAVLDTARPWSGVDKARADFGVTGNADGQPTYSKNDIVVAIVDTGIDARHLDLDGGKVICWKDVVGGRTAPYDDNGHGTHVASIVAGEGEANPAYTGVAPGAALVGIKVLNAAGSGYLSQILAGLQWAIDNRAACGIRAINLSLGVAGNSDGTDALSQMVNSVAAAGIVPVVSAGNQGPRDHTIGSPAAAQDAVTVGSMADPGEGGFFLSSFSSRGPTADGRIKPDVVSPGHRITAAKAGSTNSYITMSGTSMATPFVAGVVALMTDASPGLTPAAVKSTLTSTNSDWGPAGADIDYGAGNLDAYAAVKAASGATSGTGPGGPGHTSLSGSLAGTGSSNYYTISITNTSYPVAVTLIMPTWSTVDFDLSMYSPSGNRVALSNGTTRQETMTYRPTATGSYKLQILSYSGSGPYFVDISAGSASPDTTPPNTPTGLTVSVPLSNGGALSLSWNANTEPDLAGYNVYRSTSTGGPYAKINAGGVTTISYTDSSLTNGVPYFYVVTAADTSGNESARSNEAGGTPVDNKAPTISNLLATPSSTSTTISWNTDEPADSTIDYGTASALGLSATDATLVVNHSANLSGLSPSTIYFYQVKSRDAAGNLATSSILSFSTLSPPGAIAGRVTDASTGAALAGATVSDGTRSTTTDTTGAYTLATVPAGAYTLTASKAGYFTASQSVAVVAGATATANFSLTPSPTTGTITGRVTNASNDAPIAGAMVKAGGRTVFTDSNGNYTIANLSPGSYRVEASAAGYRKVRRTATVNAGSTIVVNFSLPRA